MNLYYDCAETHQQLIDSIIDIYGLIRKSKQFQVPDMKPTPATPKSTDNGFITELHKQVQRDIAYRLQERDSEYTANLNLSGGVQDKWFLRRGDTNVAGPFDSEQQAMTHYKTIADIRGIKVVRK